MNCREFDPVQAAYAVAQYLPAHPAVWVEQCALVGVQLFVTSDGRLSEYWGDVANRTRVAFLDSWLNLTPGGTEAVIEFLKRQPMTT
jgi:hypothetical protein